MHLITKHTTTMLTSTHIETTTSVIAPPASRILVVDSLRGFALLGILIAHITTWFDGGPLPSSVYENAFSTCLSGSRFSMALPSLSMEC